MTSTVRNRVRVRSNFARAAGAALALLIVSGLGITTPSSQAETFTVLYSFTGSSDGGYPYAGVIRDAAGNLYGTAYSGGASHYGVVFEVTSSGTQTVLYNFAGGTSDGCYPYGGVALDSSGNLYGTTSACGSSNDGVVFEVDTSGTETLLHDFAGGDKDGCYPSGGVIRDSAGNLYGTASACGSSGYGVVFEVDSVVLRPCGTASRAGRRMGLILSTATYSVTRKAICTA